jgi:hypothetical protein
MKKFFDTITDHRGNGIVGAQVLVRNYPDNSLAAIFSDDGITAIADSTVETDQRGYFEFYLADGHYNLEISGNGISNRTIFDLTISASGTILFPNVEEGSVVFAPGPGVLAGVAAELGYDSINKIFRSGAGVEYIINGSGVELPLDATRGFAHLPSMPGVPIGVPDIQLAGAVPTVIDRANKKILGFMNGLWHIMGGGGGGGSIGQQLCFKGPQGVTLTAGAGKMTFEGWPNNFVLDGISAALTKESEAGSVVIDIHVDGVTIMNVDKLVIDVAKKSTLTSAVQPALTNIIIPKGAQVDVQIDAPGLNAKGWHVYPMGTWSS